jgi:ankyrin repeat protein
MLSYNEILRELSENKASFINEPKKLASTRLLENLEELIEQPALQFSFALRTQRDDKLYLDSLSKRISTATMDLPEENCQLIDALIAYVDDHVHFRGQSWYIDRMRALGYDANPGGCCYGLTQMSMQAFLANDLNTFLARLKEINSISLSDFRNDFSDLKEKQQKLRIAGNVQSADKINQLIVDIKAFFEGILLTQSPAKFKDFFSIDDQTNLQNAKKTMPLTLSIELEQPQKKPYNIASVTGTYCKAELIEYLNTLKDTFNHYPFSLNFTGEYSASCLHEINLNYDGENKQWLLVDSNDLPLQILTDTAQVANALLNAYEQRTKIVMATEIYAQSEHAISMLDAFEKLNTNESWIKLHDITKVQAPQFFLALSLDFVDEQWIKRVLDANPTLINQGVFNTNPLRMAVQNGQIKIVKLLIEHGADVHQENLLALAMNMGNKEIVNYLLEQGVKPTLSLLTINFADYSFEAVISLLIEKGGMTVQSILGQVVGYGYLNHLLSNGMLDDKSRDEIKAIFRKPYGIKNPDFLLWLQKNYINDYDYSYNTGNRFEIYIFDKKMLFNALRNRDKRMASFLLQKFSYPLGVIVKDIQSLPDRDMAIPLVEKWVTEALLKEQRYEPLLKDVSVYRLVPLVADAFIDAIYDQDISILSYIKPDRGIDTDFVRNIVQGILYKVKETELTEKQKRFKKEFFKITESSQSNQDKTPFNLREAIEKGDLELVHFLINTHDGDDEIDLNQDNLLAFAINKGNSKIVNYLITCGAKLTVSLLKEVRFNDSNVDEVITLLFEKENMTLETIIGQAYSDGNTQLLELILGNKSKGDLERIFEKACNANNYKCLECLHKHSNFTPTQQRLVDACSNRDATLVRFLIEQCGCNPSESLLKCLPDPMVKFLLEKKIYNTLTELKQSGNELLDKVNIDPLIDLIIDTLIEEINDNSQQLVDESRIKQIIQNHLNEAVDDTFVSEKNQDFKRKLTSIIKNNIVNEGPSNTPQ